jgi:hypothetical protein
MKFLIENDITPLEWIPCGADMSIIEDYWADL